MTLILRGMHCQKIFFKYIFIFYFYSDEVNKVNRKLMHEIVVMNNDLPPAFIPARRETGIKESTFIGLINVFSVSR